MDAQAQAREDLVAIRGIMERTRDVVGYAAPHFVAWGILMAAALVATYLLRGQAGEGWSSWLWVVAVGLGWALSWVLAMRGRRRAQVRSQAGRMLGGLWLGTGVTMTLLGFAGPAGGAVSSSAVAGMLAAVLGAAYFATGVLAGRGWLMVVGAGWWAGSLVMLLWPGPHALLLMAAFMVALQAVPGAYYLTRRLPATTDGWTR
jgi:hypothetical protein